MSIEVELKAAIADPATVFGLLSGWAESEPSTYANTYYDFPGRRLTTLAAGRSACGSSTNQTTAKRVDVQRPDARRGKHSE